MASFGENLQREREMRGVTLQEISAATKISVRFLQALEAEEFTKLPGGIFTRSFIRAYAKYLGLDEDRVLAEYQLVAQPRADVDLSRLVASNPEARREGSRGPFLTLVLAVVLVGGGYGIFWYSRRAAEPPREVSPPAQVPAPAVSTPAAGQISTPAPAPESARPVAEKTSATGPGAAGPGAPTAASQTPTGLDSTIASVAEGGLVLQVAATERAWVAVDADGKTVLQRVLNPSEIQTLKAKESFDVTTGNAQGIILTLNGETLKPMGRRGEVKSIHLTESDLKKTSP
ncbi:MAG: RodZ domain-containing protein [Terriglobia bacterium]